MLEDVIIGNKLYTKMVVEDQSNLDQIVLKVLRKDTPNFLLPITTMNIDGETELRFEIMDGTRFQYFNERMNKKDFMQLMKNMLQPYKTCADWFLDYHNFLLDPQYIILHRNDYSVRYVYIPQVKPYYSDEQICQFFEELIIKTELTDDPGYTMKLFRVLKESHAKLIGLYNAVLLDSNGGENSAEQQNNARNNSFVQPSTVQTIQTQGMQSQTILVQPAESKQEPIEPVVEAKPAPDKKAGPVSGFLGKEKKVQEAGRPGVELPNKEYNTKSSAEFGKEDVQGAILDNLFGEEEETPRKKIKEAKHQKQPKQPKEAKTQKSGGGFLGGIFAKKENKNKDALDFLPNQEMKKSQEPIATNPITTNNSYSNMQMAQAVTPNTGYRGDDVTVIDDDEPNRFENKVVFQLDNNPTGFQVPSLIEIDLSKGFATVGRYDKAGKAICDYNFSQSLSFISKSHFRIEKRGEQICIIDLNSSNGTYLNGQSIIPNNPYAIQPGDIIMLSQNHRVTYKMI